MKESGQERKEKKNRYREFTASFAGLPLSVILFWLAVKQPFSGGGRDFRQKDPELKFQPLDKQMNRTKHKK